MPNKSKSKSQSKSIVASAPGSLMLFGEHAVLYGSHSMVAAIDKRATVSIKLRQDKEIILKSDLFSDFNISLQQLRFKSDKFPGGWRFVLAALNLYKQHLASGLELKIKSQISATFGFGSSSAVTVATCAALYKLVHGRAAKPLELLRITRTVIQKVQGMGSGSDCAAAVLGGVVAYKMNPLYVEKIADTLPLTVVYSGSKLATPIVVKMVREFYLQHKKLVAPIFVEMDKITLAAKKALKNMDYHELGILMNLHNSLQAALQVDNAVLCSIVFALRSSKRIYGAKISGSGLGDSLIGLGNLSKSYDDNLLKSLAKIAPNVQVVPVKIAALGVKLHK